MRWSRIGRGAWRGLQAVAALVGLAWALDAWLLPAYLGVPQGTLAKLLGQRVAGLLGNPLVRGVAIGLVVSLLGQAAWWLMRRGRRSAATRQPPAPAEPLPPALPADPPPPPTPPQTQLPPITVSPPPSGSSRITITPGAGGAVTVDYQDGWVKAPDSPRKDLYEQARKLAAENKYREAIDLFRQLLGQGGAVSEQAALFIQIGNCFLGLSELDEAAGSYREAERRARDGKDQEGLAAALGNMGLIYRIKGDLDKALDLHSQALTIHRGIGHREGEADDLGNMGNVYRIKGDLDHALELHSQALTIHRQIGYKQGEANALGNMGLVYQSKGDLDQALEHHSQALKIHRDIGNRQGEAADLGNMGLIYQTRGDLDKALGHLRQAQAIYQGMGAGGEGPDTVRQAIEEVEAARKDKQAEKKDKAA